MPHTILLTGGAGFIGSHFVRHMLRTDVQIQLVAAFIQTNVTGTFTLLEAARVFWLHEKGWETHSCRLHHISVDEV